MGEEHDHCVSCYDRSCSEPVGCSQVTCSNECGARFHACKEADHKLVCTRTVVDCLNAQYGCPFKFERKVQCSHLHHCPANVVVCNHTWFRRRLDERASFDPIPHSKMNENIDFALAFRDQECAGGSERLCSTNTSSVTTQTSGQEHNLLPCDRAPERLESPLFAPLTICLRTPRERERSLKKKYIEPKVSDVPESLAVKRAAHSTLSKSTTDLSLNLDQDFDLKKKSPGRSRAGTIVRRCSFSVSPVAFQKKDKRAPGDVSSSKLFRWKQSKLGGAGSSDTEVIVENAKNSNSSVGKSPSPSASLDPQKLVPPGRASSSNGLHKFKRKLTKAVAKLVDNSSDEPLRQAPRGKSHTCLRPLSQASIEEVDEVVQLDGREPLGMRGRSLGSVSDYSCAVSLSNKRHSTISALDWVRSRSPSCIRERLNQSSHLGSPSILPARRQHLLETRADPILGLELQLQFSTHHASTDLVRFHCGRLFRRDEIAGHREFVHANVDELLSAQHLYQRCPLATFGCKYSRSALALSAGQQLKLVKGSLCIQPSTHVSPMMLDENSSPAAHLTTLPVSVLLLICSFLDPLNLAGLSETCSHLQQIVASMMHDRGMVCLDWTQSGKSSHGSDWSMAGTSWQLTTFVNVPSPKEWRPTSEPLVAKHLKSCSLALSDVCQFGEQWRPLAGLTDVETLEVTDDPEEAGVEDFEEPEITPPADGLASSGSHLAVSSTSSVRLAHSPSDADVPLLFDSRLGDEFDIIDEADPAEEEEEESGI